MMGVLRRKLLVGFIVTVCIEASWPAAAQAKHDMVGRWQLENDCALHISNLTIMTENNQAVIFYSIADERKRMAPLEPGKGQETKNYRERENPARWYQIMANRWLEVYDGDTLLCTGRPIVTSGGMPLLDPAEEKEEHGH